MNTKTAMTVLLSGCIACGAFSCTDMDEYRKISGDEEIVYPGKIEQVVVNTESPTNVCGAIGMTLAILLFVLWIPGVGLAIAWLVALIFSIIGVCRPKKGMAIITVLLLLAGIVSLIFGFTLLKSLF